MKQLENITLIEWVERDWIERNGIDVLFTGLHINADGVDYYFTDPIVRFKDGYFIIKDKCTCVQFSADDVTGMTEEEILDLLQASDVPDIPDISGVQRAFVKLGETDATNADSVSQSDSVYRTGKTNLGADFVEIPEDPNFNTNVKGGFKVYDSVNRLLLSGSNDGTIDIESQNLKNINLFSKNFLNLVSQSTISFTSLAGGLFLNMYGGFLNADVRGSYNWKAILDIVFESVAGKIKLQSATTEITGNSIQFTAKPNGYTDLKVLSTDQNGFVNLYPLEDFFIKLKKVQNIGSLMNFKTSFENPNLITNIALVGDSRIEYGYLRNALKDKLVKIKQYAGAGTFVPGAMLSYSDVGVAVAMSDAVFNDNITESVCGHSVTLAYNKYLSLFTTTPTASFIFYYRLQANPIDLEIYVDGVLKETVTTNTGSGYGSIQVDGLPEKPENTVTRYVIKNITAGETAELYEFTFWNSNTSGIIFHNFGNAGATPSQIADWVQNNYILSDIPMDLSIIECGVNSMSAGNVATDATFIEDIANEIRNQGGKDIIVLSETDNNLAIPKSTILDYVEAYRVRCLYPNSFMFIDLFDAIPSWDNFIENGYAYLGDPVHYNTPGAEYIAEHILHKILM